MNSLFDLKGKVALITGGSSGIGRAIAEAMGRQGATVVLASNAGNDCHKANSELNNLGINAHSFVCDVSSKSELKLVVNRLQDELGAIDILVCSAGVAPHFGPISTATEEHWEQTMTVNLKSALWLTSMVIPQMVESGGGSIILISSIAGVRGNQSIGLYSLSKAGLSQLARNLAVEWGPHNIRVNSISPGVIETAFSESMISNKDVFTKRVAHTPLRRVGRPEEIAGVAVMLASSAGGFITGQNIIVDGGTTIGDGN